MFDPGMARVGSGTLCLGDWFPAFFVGAERPSDEKSPGNYRRPVFVFGAVSAVELGRELIKNKKT